MEEESNDLLSVWWFFFLSCSLIHSLALFKINNKSCQTFVLISTLPSLEMKLYTSWSRRRVCVTNQQQSAMKNFCGKVLCKICRPACVVCVQRVTRGVRLQWRWSWPVRLKRWSGAGPKPLCSGFSSGRTTTTSAPSHASSAPRPADRWAGGDASDSLISVCSKHGGNEGVSFSSQTDSESKKHSGHAV